MQEAGTSIVLRSGMLEPYCLNEVVNPNGNGDNLHGHKYPIQGGELFTSEPNSPTPPKDLPCDKLEEDSDEQYKAESD
jgi:hypothetical protein